MEIENQTVQTEDENVDINENTTTNNTGDSDNLASDVTFKSDPLERDVIPPEKKRKREEVIEARRLAEREYNQEVQEQQYKRLIHLLDRSKFFANYIVNKFNDNEDGEAKKKEKTGRKPGKQIKEENNENIAPEETKKKQDIRKFISVDVKKKIHMNSQQNKKQENVDNEMEDESEKENKSDQFQVPSYFKGDLWEYQKEGLKWLKVLYENGLNGILADEMGLGKTIQVIALLCHLFEKGQNGPYLIIAPLSTISNWVLEFEKFAPKLPVKVLHGHKNDRYTIQTEIKRKYRITDTFSTYPIVLTTYEVPLYDKHFMRSLCWRYIIIDEGHRIKNYECKLVKLLSTCKSMNRLLLTGTPLQNNLAELWALLNFLLPEIFDDLAVFEAWFDPKELTYDEGTKKFLQMEQEKHVMASLREILKPFMLRREKADVHLEIPPKKEVIVYAPLTELQHSLYKAVLNRDIEMLSKIKEPSIYTDDGVRRKRRCVLRNLANYNSYRSETEEVQSESSYQENKKLSEWRNYTDVTERNRDFLLNLTLLQPMSMYKKIVNHPYLVHCPLGPDQLPTIDNNLIRASGKLLVLDLLLAKLKKQGHKVLLFSTMTMILDIIEDYLSMRTYKYVRLDGATAIEKRTINIKTFNTDPNTFLFLISTRAGGVGLNLAAADTVIIYDSDWNPQMDIQAMARCHRIGQKKPVATYRFCTKGTIDEAIINRAEAKRVLEKMVISKETKALNLNNIDTLLELKKSLESTYSHKAVSKNQVFTEEELEKLLDRSDLYENIKPEIKKK